MDHLTKILNAYIKVDDQKLITNINSNILTSGRSLQLKRSIMNIIENSLRYSKKILVDVFIYEENFFIEIS